MIYLYIHKATDKADISEAPASERYYPTRNTHARSQAPQNDFYNYQRAKSPFRMYQRARSPSRKYNHLRYGPEHHRARSSSPDHYRSRRDPRHFRSRSWSQHSGKYSRSRSYLTETDRIPSNLPLTYLLCCFLFYFYCLNCIACICYGLRLHG